MNPQHTLDTPIEYLRGVGPEKAKVMRAEMGVTTYGELLSYFPFRYVDRTKIFKISEVRKDMPFVQLKGVLRRLDTVGGRRIQRITGVFADDTGQIELIWFKGFAYLKNSLVVGKEYLLIGKPGAFKGRLNIPHPEMEDYAAAKQKLKHLQPVYHSGEKLSAKGLSSKGIEKLQQILVPTVVQHVQENLPDSFLSRLKLPARKDAFHQLHFPQNHHALERCVKRLKFEELFFLQMRLLRQKSIASRKIKGFKFDQVGHYFNTFYEEHIPFELTGAQKRVLKELRKDMGTGAQMNRLVQGDVGSGKTLVALLTMLLALDNGYQACLMAPTEILATQHYESISALVAQKEDGSGLNVTVKLLTGSTKAKERKQLLEELASGELQFIIGTHALLEDRVQFANLGLAVIDEQHRFGVKQRARLWKKSSYPPHVLVMTATPIPRTLAMTLYGDLDVSVIDEMPPGRKPIKTVHRYEASRLQVLQFIEDEIKKGRQVYIVYPLIEESEKMDYQNLMQGYESLTRRFPLPDYQVSIVHGQMKPESKEYEMQRFVKGETQIMVATTVIEVGVNVPNASVMVIESSERFGLAQLHQLRGRVGRGSEQSYCILMTGNKLSQESKERVSTMVRTSDGFEIAEADLQLRGPGDLLGTQQSGILDLKVANLAEDGKILQVARDLALEVLTEDPDLTKPEHQAIRAYLEEQLVKRPNWGRIS